MVQINFDATQVAPTEDRSALPAGWYNAAATACEMKPTKDGSGAYLAFEYTVLDGQYKGRKVFSNLNIRNANPQAVEIAYRELSAIAHAVGVLHVQDTAMLLNIPMKLKLKVRKDKDGQYDDQNDITSYKNINHQVDVVAGGPAAQVSAPPVAGGFTPPPATQPAPAFAPPPAATTAPLAQPWQQPGTAAPAPQQPWAQPPQGVPVTVAQPAPQAEVQVAQPAPQGGTAVPPWQQPPAQLPPQGMPPQQPAAAQAAPQAEPPHPAQAAVPPWQR